MCKKCIKCGKEKELDQFKKDLTCKDGYRNVCKECIKGEGVVSNRYRKNGDYSDKECTDCHKVLPLDRFYYVNKSKQFFSSYCKDCSNKRKQKKSNGVFYRKRRLKRNYNLTEESFHNMLELQENKCLICGKVFDFTIKMEACIDHDHTTGKVRGLLCTQCNSGLGFFKDNIEYLKKAIEYLT